MKNIYAIMGVNLSIGIVSYVSSRLGDNEPHTFVNPIRETVRNNVQIFLSNPVAPSAMKVISEHQPESYEVQVRKWLDQNSEVKRRLQGMRWYGQFVVGQMKEAEFQKHFEDVLGIEEILAKKPGVLEKVQYEEWWRKYLSGEILPGMTLQAYLTPSIQIEAFSQEYPNLYHQTSKMPVWESGVHEWLDTLLIDRRMLLISMQKRVNTVKNAPAIEERLRQYGYSLTSFFSDDFRKNTGIYSVIEAITFLEDGSTFPSIARNIFLESEQGKAYISGRLDPNDALKYMEIIVESISETVEPR